MVEEHKLSQKSLQDVKKNYQQLQDGIFSCQAQRFHVKNIQTNEKYWMKVINCDSSEISFQSLEVDILNFKKIRNEFIEQLFDEYYIPETREIQLIFPWIHGNSLRELSWKFPPPSIADQLRWMKQTLSALNYLHTTHGSHGNLNPSSVWICKNDVKLVALKIPSIDEPTIPIYYSYERYTRKDYDERDDIWAFGLIFAELLLQLKPDSDNFLANQSSNEIERRVKCLVENCMNISHDIGKIIEYALQYPQSKRPTAASLSTFIFQVLTPCETSPLSHFGAGDVTHFDNFLDDYSLNKLMTAIENDIPWRQGGTKRTHHLTSIQAIVDDDGTVPIYRCPDLLCDDEQNYTIAFDPSIKLLKSKIEQLTRAQYNWCQIRKYDKDAMRTDFVSEKTLDVVAGSTTVHYFLGCKKYFVLKLKAGVHLENLKHLGDQHQNKISVQHNSLLLVGPSTKLSYLYAFTNLGKKNVDDFDYFVSITFRDIGTYYCPRYRGVDDCFLYGLGVPLQSKSQMISRYYSHILTRCAHTVSAISLGYLCSRYTTSLLTSIFRNKPNLKNVLIGTLTALSGLFARWSLLSTAKMKQNAKKWRYMAVYRLMNLYPIKFPEALRLLEEASYLELKSRLETHRSRNNSKDAESNVIYDFKISSQRLTGSHPKLEQNIHSNHIVSSYEKIKSRPQQNSTTNPLQFSVCIIVDAINDFMLTTGSFCRAYGFEDTHRIRNILPTIIDIYQYCHNNRIQVVLVTSHYRPKQFKRIADLCTSEQGRQFSFPLLDSNNGLPDIIHIKNSNSIFGCTSASKSQLLQLVHSKNILICGVTTVCCIRYAVNDLLPHTSRIYISKDSVASRDSCLQQEQQLFSQWKQNEQNVLVKNMKNPHLVKAVETWKEVFNIFQQLVNVEDEQSSSLRF